MINIAQQMAISLLDKHSLPFIAGNESDFLIARNVEVYGVWLPQSYEREMNL